MANGTSFIVQNNQTMLSGGNTVSNIPYVQAIQVSSAQNLSGRGPGGGSFHGNSASITNNIIQIDAMETSAANSGYAKNAGIFFTLNAAVNSTISLFALSGNAAVIGANAASLATDSSFTSFNGYNQMIIYNQSGVTDNTSNTLTVNVGASNGATLPVAAANTITIQPGSRMVFESTGNGYVVNATKTNITFAGNGQNVSVVVMGS